MARRYTPKMADDLFEELKSESDRAAIAVAGSLVEYALEEAILSRLRVPQTQGEADVLFRDQGILGTFYEKIWAAYFLKVIGPQVRRDLDLVRSIRNVAAHDMNPISFAETEEIASRCRELQLAKDTVPGKSNPQDFRGMFMVTVQFFTANLLLRAGDSNAEVAEAFQGLAPYLDR